METKHNVLRCTIYIIEILIFFIIQETPFLLPTLFDVKPLLILPIAISISILETKGFSLFFSAFTGFMMDMGYGSTIGLNIIILASICYIINYLFNNVIKTRFLISMLVFIISIFVVVTIDFTFYFLIKDIDNKIQLYFLYYCPIILYTIIFSPVFFYLTKLIHKIS